VVIIILEVALLLLVLQIHGKRKLLLYRLTQHKTLKIIKVTEFIFHFGLPLELTGHLAHLILVLIQLAYQTPLVFLVLYQTMQIVQTMKFT